MPYTIQFTVVNVDNGCKPLTGAAVYVWHCDQDGNYSMYGSATEANYLRGVQEVDANGVASFTSIFPACYSGRWPHVHFEVYPSVSDATNATNKLATSQIALPTGCVRVGVRDQRLRAERVELVASVAELRHGLQ